MATTRKRDRQATLKAVCDHTYAAIQGSGESESDLPVPKDAAAVLGPTGNSWDNLESAVKAHKFRGTRTRTNLVPDGTRDNYGYLQDSIPSDVVRNGPVFEACKAMLPGVEFDSVTLNHFTSHEQCQPHRDKKNQGLSYIALLGSFSGGALAVEDGRRLEQVRQWMISDGSQLQHWVEPFNGDRYSVVVYSRTSTPTAAVFPTELALKQKEAKKKRVSSFCCHACNAC